MKIQLVHTHNDIIKLENLLLAWKEFIIGKKSKKDVQIFSRYLMDNIVSLNQDLSSRAYQHGGYESFFVNDPKRRHIHKASVRDRLLHHAIYRILYPFFDKIFIGDSYSCRLDKGVHKALNRFRRMYYEVSKNNHRACWILKCDIKKFFDSIDHNILINILKQYILDRDIVWLLENVIASFRTVGLPLGNLTSQLFANIYLNKFDQFIRHKLKAKHYIRYADDFVILHHDKQWLEEQIPKIKDFLQKELSLALHPNKLFLLTMSSGLDFLGWKHFFDHRVVRKTTEKRMLKRLQISPTNETLQSYLGLSKHGDGLKLRDKLLNEYWLWCSTKI